MTGGSFVNNEGVIVSRWPNVKTVEGRPSSTMNCDRLVPTSASGKGFLEKVIGEKSV